ncbi:MAG: hypothetical protein ACOYLB_15775 [Phototrophicaceae bacterium]
MTTLNLNKVATQQIQLNPYLVYEFRYERIHCLIFSTQQGISHLNELERQMIFDDSVALSEKLFREHDPTQPYLVYIDLGDYKTNSTSYFLQQTRKLYRRVPPPSKMRVVYTHSNRLMLSLAKSLMNTLKIGKIERRFYQRDEYAQAIAWLTQPF